MRFATETSAGACVYKKTDEGTFVLLVQPFETRNVWGIPKGHVEGQENFSQTALREVYEETGITVKLEDALTPVYARYNKQPKRVISFLAQQTCEVAAYPHDGENFRVEWHSIDSLPPLHLYQIPLFDEIVPLLKFKTEGIVPENVMERFDVVYSYANVLDDWIEIKKLVVIQCAPANRKLFSRRHESSNLQQTNSLERHLGALWSERTGRPINWPKVHVDPI